MSDYIRSYLVWKGAVRDVIEQVMKVQGNWEDDDTQSIIGRVLRMGDFVGKKSINNFPV